MRPRLLRLLKRKWYKQPRRKPKPLSKKLLMLPNTLPQDFLLTSRPYPIGFNLDVVIKNTTAQRREPLSSLKAYPINFLILVNTTTS